MGCIKSKNKRKKEEHKEVVETVLQDAKDIDNVFSLQKSFLDFSRKLQTGDIDDLVESIVACMADKTPCFDNYVYMLHNV